MARMPGSRDRFGTPSLPAYKAVDSPLATRLLSVVPPTGVAADDSLVPC